MNLADRYMSAPDERPDWRTLAAAGLTQRTSVFLFGLGFHDPSDVTPETVARMRGAHAPATFRLEVEKWLTDKAATPSGPVEAVEQPPEPERRDWPDSEGGRTARASPGERYTP